jgi:Skp family chaperone for outer membrane proteins
MKTAAEGVSKAKAIAAAIQKMKDDHTRELAAKNDELAGLNASLDQQQDTITALQQENANLKAAADGVPDVLDAELDALLAAIQG